MTERDSTAEALRRLVTLVAENGLRELTVEAEGVQITVRAEPEAAYAPVAHTSPAPASLPALPAPATTAPPVRERPARGVPLESPMVGVFYHSSSPEDPPFVMVGDTVRVGQPIGLIEAMKVFSEVPSEVAGRVVEMPVESGRLVQIGQALIYVEPV